MHTRVRHVLFTQRRLKCVFDEKQRAVTPGQAIVFYDGDVIAAGGWITRY